MYILRESVRKEIKSELRSLFDRVIKKFSEKDFWDPERYKLERPFHSSLITVDFWISPKFERSFTTSLGQTVYERVAKCIASQFADKAENKKRIERHISTGELNTIQTILNELDLSTEETKEKGLERKPNWKKEIEEVLQSKTDEQVRTVVIMDLYFRRNEKEYFFEIKSSKPNKDQSKVSKEKMLKLQAMYNGKVNTYFAFPDNPYLKRELYALNIIR